MSVYNIIYLSVWINISSAMTWSLSNVPTLALQNTRNAFIGYYNKTVQILGGYYSQNDTLEFPLDVEWNTSTTTCPTTTSITFGYQWSQSSIQIDEELWILPYHTQYFNVYHLVQKSIIKTISFPGTATYGRCVTSDNEYIFIIGGYSNIKEFHIYNRLTTAWSTGTSLTNARWYHSCNVVGNIVHIIGCYPNVDNVEYIPLPSSGTWIQMNDRLSSVKYSHRSVVFEEFIYVIGGFADGNGYIDQLDIIDTISKTISSPPTNKLVYAKYCVSAIVVENVIYVFGGYPYTDNIHYQYASISTHNQTNNPTSQLTYIPTISASNIPTLSHPTHPTLSPSANLSESPTYNPTMDSLQPSLTASTVPIDMNNTIISPIITTINLRDESNNNLDNNTIILIIISVVICISIAIITIVFLLYFKKTNMKNNNNNNNNNIEEGEGEYIDNREGVEENIITQNKDIDVVMLGIESINDNSHNDIETEYI